MDKPAQNPLSIERRERCVIITLHHPPVNALTRALAAALDTALDAALEETHGEDGIERLIITGQGKIFIAGADIREIERITRGQAPPDLSYLNALLAKIEDFPAPVVMALNGAALGIGLETAMAGHYRVMAQSASVGLPEVKLGLIPGAGGTQRLPRLVGLARALAMIESGVSLNAAEALDAGVVDDAVPDEDLLRVAIESRVTRRRTRDLPLPISRAVLALLGTYGVDDFDQGLILEEEIFRGALLSIEARALVFLFFAEREALKLPKDPPSGSGAPSVIAHSGKAVEVVWGAETGAQLLEAECGRLRKDGKIPVLVREPLLQRLMGIAGAGDTGVLRQEIERSVSEGVVQRPGDLAILLVHGAGLPSTSIVEPFGLL
jgi:enoyl-CoA hydratase/carnithine racemase